MAMRIAMFHNLPSGGAKRAVYEWTRRLTSKHRIDVYTLSSADHVYCDIRPLVQQHRVFDFTPRRLFRSPWGRLNQLQWWQDLGELTQIGHQVANEINAGEYDVVFAHTCRFTFIPAFLRFVETPAVYYLHEPFGRSFTREFQRPYLQSKGWRVSLNRLDPLIKLYNRRLHTIQHQCLRQTKRLLANSVFTRNYMKKIFGVEALVCRLGVNLERFRPIPDTRKEDFVLSVGELTPRKGFAFVVESLGQLSPDKRPKLKLACNRVDPLERHYIENLAVEHGVNLQVLTHLNTDELRVQYSKALICVYAPVLEPFGLVPLESMACGTAVVGVREGGIPESVIHKHTGLLVERDLAQFAAAVQHLLANPHLAAEYGRNGQEHVLRSWTWDRSVDALENHLVECVAKV